MRYITGYHIFLILCKRRIKKVMSGEKLLFDIVPIVCRMRINITFLLVMRLIILTTIFPFLLYIY